MFEITGILRLRIAYDANLGVHLSTEEVKGVVEFMAIMSGVIHEIRGEMPQCLR